MFGERRPQAPKGLILSKTAKRAVAARAEKSSPAKRASPAKRKRRSPEELKDRIIAAAGVEFRRGGYAKATTAAIAHRAKVTETQIFRYFDSKANLFREAIFKPQVLKQGGAELEIQLHGCPLKDAWREAGLTENKVETLCRIAGAVDKGLFEGAGFKFANRTWQPGAAGCCFLHIERG